MYIDTCMNIRECIRKGYLAWEPAESGWVGAPINQVKNYYVSRLQGTYIIIERDS